MPHTINGIGTWYWGKRNVYARRGTCEFCNRVVTLESYDTTLYFVLLFLPIIPIKRKRVIGECGACRRHRVVDLNKWETARAHDIAAAMEAFEQTPTNVEVAQRALGTALAYEDEVSFLGLAELVESHLPHDPLVQAAMGDGFRFFGRMEAAEEAYRHSLQLRDDPKVRQALAFQLMRDGQPDQALLLLSNVLSQHRSVDIEWCFLLVESYQSQGLHDQAMALLDEWAAALPGLEKNKEFIRYHKLSQKRQASGTAVVSANLKPERGGGSGKSFNVTGRFARWFAPILIAAGSLIYVAVCFHMGENRPVHVVNGLDVAYSMTIGDQTVTVPAQGHLYIQISEGDLKLHVNDAARHIEPATVHISTPFWGRAFNSRMFIINPDRTAVLTWEKTWYAPEGAATRSPEAKLHVGSILYDFDGIDYPFEPFPHSIQMDTNQSAVERTRVSLLAFDNPLNAPNTIEHYCDRAAAMQYMQRKLRNEPQAPRNVIWLSVLEDQLPSEQFLNFCKSMLRERPVPLHFHRSYQDMQERLHPEYDLEAEYRAYAAKEPENAELIYLEGRVTKDRAKKNRLFAAAASAEPPCAMAANALAWDAMMIGDFEHATTLADQANQLQQHDLVIELTLIESLFASRRFDDLLKLLAKIQNDNPHDVMTRLHRLRALILAGKPTDVQLALDDLKQFYREAYGPDSAVQADLLADTQASYARGRVSEYVRAARQSIEPHLKWAAEVTAGSWVASAPLLEKVEKPPAVDHLLMAAGALTINQRQLAKSQIDKAVALLRDGSPEERRLADWLSDSQPCNAEDALAISMLPEQKRVVLTLLGLKFPQEKQRFFELARKLNFMPTFPKLTLDEMLK